METELPGMCAGGPKLGREGPGLAGGSGGAGARRVEPVPLSEKISNGLIKIIALEDIKDIPKVYGNILIVLFFLALFGVFLFFLLTDYSDNRSAKFLSLDETAGDCAAVLSPVNGVYMIDTNGYWQGETGFDYAKAIYSLDFNNFLGSSEDFALLLMSGYNEIRNVGQVALNQSLAVNLLFWMIYSVSASWKDTVQQFQMTGTAAMVFDRRYYKAALSNANGVCDVKSKTTFDKHNGVLSTVFNVQEYTKSPACRDIVNPYHMGYIPAFDVDEFRLDIDVRTLVTGAAINMGLLLPSELAEIPQTSTTVSLHGTTYDIDTFYNPRYPGMDPLYCQRDKQQEALYHNATYMCVIRLGNTYMYPTFNHVGSNGTKPEPCVCGSMTEQQLYFCNEFNFVPSMVFYQFNESYTNESEHDLIHFSIINGISGYDNNRNAHAAAFDAVIPTDLRNDSAWRKRAYEFCSQNTTRGCSMFTILMSDFGNAVSDYYYQLLYGACNDSFTISEEALQRVLTTPPVNVEERYYECRSTKINALYEAFGIAVGNLLLTRFVLLGLYLFLILLFRRLSKTAEFPETYTVPEKMKVLNFFAFQLLLARDGKYPPGSGSSLEAGEGEQRQESVLTQLHDELSRISRTDRFFPMVNSKKTRTADDEFENVNPILSDSSDGRAQQSSDGRTVSKIRSRLAEQRKWAGDKVFMEELDNPLDPKKSMKLL